MIITFCGHSDFRPTPYLKQKMLSILESTIGDATAEFYLGGYGSFDSFAYTCAKTYQTAHPLVSLVYVSPYVTPRLTPQEITQYDQILYPPLENIPPRFAISHRNRYMVDRADYVVAYINRSFGGAYQTYTYAERQHKEVVNLADMT